MKIDGRCHCGAIRFAAEALPDGVVICHCSDCQTFSGSAFRVSVFTRPGSFMLLSGTPKIYLKTAETGAKRRQAFCADCGTSIYSSADTDAPTSQAVRAGTLSQRENLTPVRQIWCRSKRPWVGDLDTIESLETQTAR